MATEQTPIVAEQMLNWGQFMNALVPAVLIALATFGASWWATRQAHELDRRRREEREAAEVKRMLRALRVELLTAWERYQEDVGKAVENHEQKQRFQKPYRTERSPCPIYDGAATLLGTLENEPLVEAIVEAHADFRSLLEAHARNTEMNDTILRGAGESTRAQGPRNNAATTTTKNVLKLHSQAKESVQKAVIAIEQSLPEDIDPYRVERAFRSRVNEAGE